ncbi:hypothetical protein AGR2A_Cc100037 [Agrobacterium genomosp. 2 str. CFBP 5494]|uniref:Uncharacterized protein n=1 Tax=Agrobacterium genomosp. 2 str. CFBP 5494 TaxID=1183436 RepID=A0A9W5AXE7_9HYPH|nr:hypothetical protein AGR2A_Cc100037 [Agrobacterium genomosp. 2 str. CFBP 5494]
MRAEGSVQIADLDTAVIQGTAGGLLSPSLPSRDAERGGCQESRAGCEQTSHGNHISVYYRCIRCQ